ncbi:OB-fold domain-containing protein [Mycobacterium syngnathidarum]
MTNGRPVPVPDRWSTPYWEAAARGVFAVACCRRCGTLTMPPDVVCLACSSTDPGYEFVPVSGRGVVRSWTVVRQSFLPGFDLPFVLVDVELAEQPDLRVVARLLDGPDRQLRWGVSVRLVFETLTEGIAVPAFEFAP